MDDNIAIWTITWTRKNRGRWSEEILFIFPENFTHPDSLLIFYTFAINSARSHTSAHTTVQIVHEESHFLKHIKFAKSAKARFSVLNAGTESEQISCGSVR